MFYTLSNNCTRHSIEREFKRVFKYGKLYEKISLINGLEEKTINIITAEHQEEILFAIWGLLPNDYVGDWSTFQKIHNTLNINLKQMDCMSEYFSANTKRCVVVVSGFFTNFYKDGELYPYYVYQKLDKPFLLAGMYNQLDDGFLTCSLILTNANKFINKINSFGGLMPLILKKEEIENWLNYRTDISLLETDRNDSLCAHTINKELFDNSALTESVIAPYFYQGVPNYFFSDNS